MSDLAHSLPDATRAHLMQAFDRDGFVILPEPVPDDLAAALLAAIDRLDAAHPESSLKLANCVDLDPAFRQLMVHPPLLQLSHDAFGPMFHLNQSNLQVRRREEVVKPDFVRSTPWHADGPRPGLFPSVNGAMGLHYLKFGVFLTDLTHGNGGSLQVVRGSHRRPELDGLGGVFDSAAYADDVVRFDCPAGTIVAFHQALWHAAPANESMITRKNIYISYCPTWMRPVDREFPDEAALAGLSSVARWLLGEPRPAERWWLPSAEDKLRLRAYARATD